MKKKIISLFIVIMLIISMFALSTCAKSKPDKILVLGDSIATGYGLEGYPGSSVKNYSNILAADYSASVTNLAVDGATSSEIAAKIATAGDAVKNADTIVVSAGGNDIFGLLISDIKSALSLPASASAIEMQTALATNSNAIALIMAYIQNPVNAAKYVTASNGYAANLTSIVTAIRTANQNAELYIQTIYNPFDGVTGFEAISAMTENVLANINGAVNNNAASGNYKAIDVYTAFKGKALLLTNIAKMDIHPNADGHKLIAAEISKAIGYVPGNNENPNTGDILPLEIVFVSVVILSLTFKMKSRMALQ